jgi:hypothetical protein
LSVDDVRLNELDREEFWDVARKLNPQLSREDFDQQWDHFQQDKAARLARLELQ